jgi:transposase
LFGFLTRGGEVYTAIILNPKTETLLKIIKEKVHPESKLYTDSFKAYDTLYVSDFHHRWINHSTLFPEERNHINEIENFWNPTNRYLRLFNGIKSGYIYLFLKEYECA